MSFDDPHTMFITQSVVAFLMSALPVFLLAQGVGFAISRWAVLSVGASVIATSIAFTILGWSAPNGMELMTFSLGPAGVLAGLAVGFLVRRRRGRENGAIGTG